jgi:DNA polymerase-4
MPRSTAHTRTILTAVKQLLADAMPMIERDGVTLVGISVSNLDNDDAVQLTLPFDHYTDALDVALDELRERFGSAVVTRAVHVGRDPGLTVPLLPD